MGLFTPTEQKQREKRDKELFKIAAIHTQKSTQERIAAAQKITDPQLLAQLTNQYVGGHFKVACPLEVRAVAYMRLGDYDNMYKLIGSINRIESVANITDPKLLTTIIEKEEDISLRMDAWQKLSSDGAELRSGMNQLINGGSFEIRKQAAQKVIEYLSSNQAAAKLFWNTAARYIHEHSDGDVPTYHTDKGGHEIGCAHTDDANMRHQDTGVGIELPPYPFED